jgi:hypothetical protein
MAPDEVSAREKALDFYQIEPTLLEVAPIKLSSAAGKPRDHLVSRWQRRSRLFPLLERAKRET